MKTYLFTGRSCWACKQLKPKFATFCADHGITYNIVDCEEEEILAEKYNVRDIPTIIQDRGDDIVRITGYKNDMGSEFLRLL